MLQTHMMTNNPSCTVPILIQRRPRMFQKWITTAHVWKEMEKPKLLSKYLYLVYSGIHLKIVYHVEILIIYGKRCPIKEWQHLKTWFFIVFASRISANKNSDSTLLFKSASQLKLNVRLTKNHPLPHSMLFHKMLF